MAVTKRVGKRAPLCGPAGEQGFTMIEVMIAVIIMGIMMAAVFVTYNAASKKTETSTVLEQVKEELRRVYSLADSGQKTAGVRHRYRITFHNNGGTPPNAWLVERSVDAGASWTVVTADKNTSNKVLTGNWIKPSDNNDIRLTFSNTGVITYVPKGSIIETGIAGEEWISVSATSTSGTKTVYVNNYGDIR